MAEIKKLSCNKGSFPYITPEQYSIKLCIDCSTLQVFERNETSNINTGLMRVCVLDGIIKEVTMEKAGATFRANIIQSHRRRRRGSRNLF